MEPQVATPSANCLHFSTTWVVKRGGVFVPTYSICFDDIKMFMPVDMQPVLCRSMLSPWAAAMHMNDIVRDLCYFVSYLQPAEQ